MKSTKEIRDMIQTSPDHSARTSHVHNILSALLDHVELLESKLTPSQKPSLTTEGSRQPVDYRQPHKFEFDKDHGTYRTCKCGLSEENAIHTK